MKPSLFRDRPARKARLTMMVAGAVLVHFGIVGVGAIWRQPATAERKDEVTIIDPRDGLPDDIQYVQVDNEAPALTENHLPPTLDALVPPSVAPVPQAPEMDDPSEATPFPPKPKHALPRPGNVSATANFVRAVPGMPGAPSGNPGSLTGGSGRTGVQGWKTPRPPYPHTVLAGGLQGATTVRITTDANGNVATVEIVRSTGNALLDHHTQIYVREFWKGPPNAARTTEFVYQIP